jgi:hypothetical protein
MGKEAKYVVRLESEEWKQRKRPAEHVGEDWRLGGGRGSRKDQAGCQR